MNSILDCKDHLNVKHFCEKILDFEGVRFVGIIDKMGNILVERFREDVVPFENDTKRRMLYMQMVLEITMRKEFDSSLGSLDYIVSRRGKCLMITVPFGENVILVSTSHDAEMKKIVSKINTVFGLDIMGGDV